MYIYIYYLVAIFFEIEIIEAKSRALASFNYPKSLYYNKFKVNVCRNIQVKLLKKRNKKKERYIK